MRSLVLGLALVCATVLGTFSHAALNNENNPHEHCMSIASLSSTTTVYGQIVDYKQYWRIKAMQVMDPTGIAADNTNYLTITLQNGATVIATYDTRAANQGALSAGVPGPGSVNSANQDVAPLGVLKAVVTVHGTGATNAGALLCYDHAVK